MTSTEATAEVFWTAFQALKRKEREAFLQKFMRDRSTLEDIRYATIIEERKKEPTIPLRDYLARRAKKKK